MTRAAVRSESRSTHLVRVRVRVRVRVGAGVEALSYLTVLSYLRVRVRVP